MNHFVDRLPWRIAALAGLLVGGISLLTGSDPWTCLWRLSLAFAVFGTVGFGLKLLLQNSDLPVPPPAQGLHFDQTTPEDGPEEPTAPASKNAGDVR